MNDRNGPNRRDSLSELTSATDNFKAHNDKLAAKYGEPEGHRPAPPALTEHELLSIQARLKRSVAVREALAHACVSELDIETIFSMALRAARKP